MDGKACRLPKGISARPILAGVLTQAPGFLPRRVPFFACGGFLSSIRSYVTDPMSIEALRDCCLPELALLGSWIRIYRKQPESSHSK
jgi:hypothetical protein